jgi:deoxycytidylate deaminase
MKWCTALHAEERAIINAAGKDLHEATLIQRPFRARSAPRRSSTRGIREVVYVEAYPDAHGVILFKQAELATRRFEGVRSRNFERYFASIQSQMEKQGEAEIRAIVGLP